MPDNRQCLSKNCENIPLKGNYKMCAVCSKTLQKIPWIAGKIVELRAALLVSGAVRLVHPWIGRKALI